MASLELTKTQFKQGVWQGIITGSGEDQPIIEVTHENAMVPDVTLTHNAKADYWAMTVPIPSTAIADGVQTLMIRDVMANAVLGDITLIAGDAVGDDIRAEIHLLREELDLLKRAFRRHCVETT